MAIEEQMETLVDRLLLDYDHGRDIDQMELFRNPDRDVVIGCFPATSETGITGFTI